MKVVHAEQGKLQVSEMILESEGEKQVFNWLCPMIERAGFKWRINGDLVTIEKAHETETSK